MTREDIIRMAKEAGLTQKPFCRWGGYLDDLERFAALVAAAEREACAKVCEDEAKQYFTPVAIGALETAARIIRSRGEVKP